MLTDVEDHAAQPRWSTEFTAIRGTTRKNPAHEKNVFVINAAMPFRRWRDVSSATGSNAIIRQEAVRGNCAVPESYGHRFLQMCPQRRIILDVLHYHHLPSRLFQAAHESSEVNRDSDPSVCIVSLVSGNGCRLFPPALKKFALDLPGLIDELWGIAMVSG